MRLLLDQDVYAITARFLREAGHDILTASDAGCSRASDIELLSTAMREHRVLVTRDRHFGSLVFVSGMGSGVIYLRMLPSDASDVHAQLSAVLTLYSEEQLQGAFIVVEADRHRFRRPPSDLSDLS